MPGTLRAALTGGALLMLWLCARAAEPTGMDRRVEVRIEAPTMMAALVQFSQQTGLQLLFPTEGATALAAPRVSGHFTPRAALEQLLRDSGLTFEFVNPRTVSISVKTAPGEQVPAAMPVVPSRALNDRE